MSKPTLSRDDVHRISESCSDMEMGFQPIATRLLREQSSLKNFIESNFKKIDPMVGQIAVYMLSVCVRVFEQSGTRIKKVNKTDIAIAQKKVQAQIDALLPPDEGFCERAKAVSGRTQEHLLDEILWALYEREERKEEEANLDPKQSALIYIILWTCVESLHQKWKP